MFALMKTRILKLNYYKHLVRQVTGVLTCRTLQKNINVKMFIQGRARNKKKRRRLIITLKKFVF